MVLEPPLLKVLLVPLELRMTVLLPEPPPRPERVAPRLLERVGNSEARAWLTRARDCR